MGERGQKRGQFHEQIRGFGDPITGMNKMVPEAKRLRQGQNDPKPTSQGSEQMLFGAGEALREAAILGSKGSTFWGRLFKGGQLPW